MLNSQAGNSNNLKRSALQRYSVAVLAVIISTVARALLMPVLGSTSPFLLFVFAAIFSAWYGGLNPGLLTTGLSALAGTYLFALPYYSFEISSIGDFVRLNLYIAIGISVSWLTEQLHRAKRQAEASAAQADKHLESLDESEKRFCLLLEGVKDYAIYTLDPQGHIIIWNQGAQRIKKYRPEEIIGQHFSVFYCPEDIAAGKPEYNLQKAAELGKFEDQGLRLRKDGSQFWAEVVITALIDEKGNLIGFTKVTRDITTRKQVEAELQVRARQQAAIAQLGQLALASNSINTLINQTVTAINQILDVEYASVLEILPDGNSLLVRAGVGWEAGIVGQAKVSAGVNSHAGYTLVTNEPVIIEDLRTETRFMASPILHDHNVISGICVIIPEQEHHWGILSAYTTSKRIFTQDDVHFFQAAANILAEAIQRKRAEEERTHLLKREQAARALAEAAAERVKRLQIITDAAIAPLSLHDMLHELLSRISEILDVDTAVILLTDAESKGLVVRAATGIEQETEQLKIPIGQGFAGRIALQRKALAIEKDAYKQVYAPILREQQIQSLMGVPLLFEDKVLGVLYVGTLKARQFTHSDKYLLQLVAERLALAIDRANLYEAEQKARQDAESANRLKDEFLSIVSHELRTPLNSILGWAQMLRSRKLHETITNKALETIERNAKQQVKLIDDILDVSRIIRGKIRLRMYPVSLDRVIELAVANLSATASAKNIQIETIIAPAVGKVSGDSDRLQQVVWNLLANAIKFTPEGGQVEIKLEMQKAKPRTINDDELNPHKQSYIYPSCFIPQASEYAEITVSDTGKGINFDFLPHVFEGFRQADGSITRSEGGLGLGLTIVRYLVEMHAGTIEVNSGGKGKGATFIIRLPLILNIKDQNAKLEGQEFNSDGFSNNFWALDGLQVLVVENDPDTCDLIATVLGEYGVKVTVVSTVVEALSVLEELKPDILLSDVSIPGEDGYSLIQKIRQLEPEQGGHIPAIALTTFAREEERLRAIQAGFQMHISKPVEPLKLALVVATVLRTGGLGDS